MDILIVLAAAWFMAVGYIAGYVRGEKNGKVTGYRNGKSVARSKFWSE
jgi:hypothetical protein